jgi:hypothetical protein
MGERRHKMASLELITNLKLIDGSARTSVPTPEELPLGYMCFGIVNSRASIWGNYDGSVHDLVDEGQAKVTIVQVTGQSTTAVISQKGVTDAIATAKQEVVNSLGSAASKDVGTAAGNVPVLDSNGKLVESIIPAVAITETYVVDSETAMLALNAQVGDVAIRTDVSKSFILQTTPATTAANWKELLTPDSKVISVNGKQGAVVLTGEDIASIFKQASSRTNILSNEALSVSLSKISKWFADLKGLAFKDQIVATTDITGVIPVANLPTATASAKGIASFGNGLNVASGVVTVRAGQGITVNANGIAADVVLKIATI